MHRIYTLFLFMCLFVGCEVPELDTTDAQKPGITVQEEQADVGSGTYVEASNRQLESAGNEMLSAATALKNELKNIKDEGSADMRAGNVERMFDKFQRAVQLMVDASRAAEPSQLQAWQRANLARFEESGKQLGQEIGRVQNAASVPLHIKQSLLRKFQEIGQTLMELDQGVPAVQSPEFNASPTGDGMLTIVIQSVPEQIGGKNVKDLIRDALSDYVMEIHESLSTDSVRKSKYNLRDGVFTIRLSGYNDVNQFSEALDLGEVIEVDQQAAKITIHLDQSKLPEGWDTEEDWEDDDWDDDEEF